MSAPRLMIEWSAPVQGPAPEWRHGKCLPQVIGLPEPVTITFSDEKVYAPIPDWALVNNIRS